MGFPPIPGPYTIDDRCFVVPSGKEVVKYSVVTWSMFGGYTSICRKDMLSEETLAENNAKLKKGKSLILHCVRRIRLVEPIQKEANQGALLDWDRLC